jgi:hypothetical protein
MDRSDITDEHYAGFVATISGLAVLDPKTEEG